MGWTRSRRGPRRMRGRWTTSEKWTDELRSRNLSRDYMLSGPSSALPSKERERGRRGDETKEDVDRTDPSLPIPRLREALAIPSHARHLPSRPCPIQVSTFGGMTTTTSPPPHSGDVLSRLSRRTIRMNYRPLCPVDEHYSIEQQSREECRGVSFMEPLFVGP